MARRYLVVSDLHLADIENHDDGWRYYKHARFTFDAEFDQVIQKFEQLGDPTDTRVLILNGDIIDFDLVRKTPTDVSWPISASERKRGLEPTEEKSCWKLRCVFQDHPQFLETLTRFLSKGHTVVYIAGNHDPEFYFQGVRDEFLAALQQCATEKQLPFRNEQVVFERWFYYVPGEIYAEHGHQYDNYNSYRYLLSPTVLRRKKIPTIALPTGNLANRYLLCNAGYFNPHAADFILNIFRYVGHWLKYYAFTRRNLFVPYLIGSVQVLFRLLRTKNKILRYPPDNEALLKNFAAQKQLPLETVQALDRLKREPITNRAYLVAREFWLDRILLACIMIGSTIFLLVRDFPIWVRVMVPLSSFPLLFLIYEWFAHGENIFSIERESQRFAFRIAKLIPTKVVTFGHTHVPEVVPLIEGVSYVNTGTWAPIFRRGSKEKLKRGLRNALFVSIEGDHCEVRLDTFVPPDPPQT